MDALIPAYEELQQRFDAEGKITVAALESGVQKAEEGCEQTRHMDAKCGRARYVNKSYLTDVDAGAYGVTIWMKAIQRQMNA